MDRLTVLGGGGPFTLGLIEALLGDRSLSPFELVLYGRTRDSLELVRAYAASRLGPLGWEVVASTDLPEALSGARYVIHQIRYGGLEGRDEDERLASRFGAVGDETLGPGALNSALRMAPLLRVVAGAISAAAPEAWVLNLTNPLSVATTILADEGVERCIGLCELPSTTAGMVAGLLGIPLSRLDWHYRGLNHRGFIVGLRSAGEDQLPRLISRLNGDTLGGIPASTIAKLEAVPTKYFALMQEAGGPPPGRAEYVRDLRDRIVQELRTAPEIAPPSLRLRRLPWYEESVVPALASLGSDQPLRQVINLRCKDGVTREVHATLSAGGLSPEPPPRVSEPVRIYLERFERHERRVLDAVRSPSAETIENALAVDPTLGSASVRSLTEALCARHARCAANAPSLAELS